MPVKQKWTIERRLAFIEFRLQWDGKVNRTDVATKFGISLNQATNDLVAYKKAAPQNIRYDLSVRAYVRGEDFSPRYNTTAAQNYLSQLLASGGALQSLSEFWIGLVPPHEVLTLPIGEVANEILHSIVGAILSAEPVDGLLQTDKEPHPYWVTIVPRALLMDGERWCIRAFSSFTERFETIPLARVVEIRGASQTFDIPFEDEEWSTVIDLKITPNPNLGEADRNTIIRDFGMKDGSTSIRVRRALLPQLIMRLGISTPPSPGDRLIVLDAVDAGNVKATP